MYGMLKFVKGGFDMEYIASLPSLEGGRIFDTHAHYDDSAFDGDRDELLNEMHRYGVGCGSPSRMHKERV